MALKRSLESWLILIVYSLPFWLAFQPLTEFLRFLIGLGLGAALLIADERFLSPWYNAASPDQSPRSRLITRSILFLICYVFVTIFVMTSTGSVVGIGVVLALGVLLSVELWQTWRSVVEFQQRFGWQLPHSFTQSEQHQLTSALTAFVAICSVLVLI